MHVKAQKPLLACLPPTPLQQRGSLSTELATSGARPPLLAPVTTQLSFAMIVSLSRRPAQRAASQPSAAGRAAAAPPPARHHRPTSHQPAALLNWPQQVFQRTLG